LYAKPQGRQAVMVNSRTVSPDTFSVTFNDLSFYTRYAVSMKAENSNGFGDTASSSIVRTAQQPNDVKKAKPVASNPVLSPNAPAAASKAPRVAPSTKSSSPATTAQKATEQAQPFDPWYGVVLPILIVLMIAAIIALIYVLRYNRRVDRINAAIDEQLRQQAISRAGAVR